MTPHRTLPGTDHFKTYNDRRGHPAGDVMLRELRSRWSLHVRDIHVRARIGGEGRGTRRACLSSGVAPLPASRAD